MIEVATTELARHLGDYLSRVRYGGETVLVLKSGTPVAELRPTLAGDRTLGEFLSIWHGAPSDPDFARDLESVNAADKAMENPWD